jgi:DNA-directed RNA polymerase alpha subunit
MSSTITGMEDVTEVILNLKQIYFKRTVDDVDHEKSLLRSVQEVLNW